MINKIISAVITLLFLIGCEGYYDSPPEAPACWITKPSDYSKRFQIGDTVLIEASCYYSNVEYSGYVKKVDFLFDDSLINSYNHNGTYHSTSYQYKLITDSISIGYHLIKVTATGGQGLSKSDTITINLFSPQRVK